MASSVKIDRANLKPLPIGKSNWAEFSHTNDTVDKTLLIKDLLDDDTHVELYPHSQTTKGAKQMKSVKLVVALLSATILALSLRATDWAWLASPATANWLTGVNWSTNGVAEAWAAAAGDTATFGASDKTTVNVDGSVTLTKMNVSGADYTFTNGTLNLNGSLTVAANRTATVKGVLNQPATTTRFSKEGAGTLVLEGDPEKPNAFNRFAVRGGTLVVSGGVHRVTGTSSAAGEGSITASLAGSSTFVLTGGANFSFDTSSSYASNSGCDMLVTNGTFNCLNLSEFLNGFQDNNGAEAMRSTLTIADGGTFIAKKYRLGKLSKGTDKPNYARTYLNRGGRLVVREFGMDGGNTLYKGRMDFDGGILVTTNSASDTDSTWIPVTSSAGNNCWGNVVLNVMEGGAWIEPRTFCSAQFSAPFSSETEQDGGLHVTNSYKSYYTYYNQTNSTYKGGFWLHGANVAVYYDRVFGAVPESPKRNIFFMPGTPEHKDNTLHFSKDVEIAPTRQVYIASNAVAVVGAQDGKTARIRGTIFGEPNSVFYVSSQWSGWTILDPGEGKTNTVGRFAVHGNLMLASGTTVVTSNSQANAGSSQEALYVWGGGQGFGKTSGRLVLAGGNLKTIHYHYINVEGHCEVIITNGHFDAASSREYLNGLSSPAKTTVGGKGVLTVPQVRITQCKNLESDGQNPSTGITLSRGGLIRTGTVRIDRNQPDRLGYFAFDGGVLQAYKENWSVAADSFLGLPSSLNHYERWTNQQVRVCSGGAIIDSNGYNIQVNQPLWSWAEEDGGLTKRGDGTLTIANVANFTYRLGYPAANTYNGVTRVEKGTLAFTREEGGFPGGDIAFTAEGLAEGSPLLKLPSLSFRDGKGLRIENAENLDPEKFGRRSKTILSLTKNGATISSIPSVTFVSTNGTSLASANGWKNWTIKLSADGRSLTLGCLRGMAIIVK